MYLTYVLLQAVNKTAVATPEKVVTDLITPILGTAFKYLSIFGGAVLWYAILTSVLYLILGKIANVPWARGMMIWNSISAVKWTLFGIAMIWILSAVIAYIAAKFGANISWTKFATDVLYIIFIAPWFEFWNFIKASLMTWKPF